MMEITLTGHIFMMMTAVTVMYTRNLFLIVPMLELFLSRSIRWSFVAVFLVSALLIPPLFYHIISIPLLRASKKRHFHVKNFIFGMFLRKTYAVNIYDKISDL